MFTFSKSSNGSGEEYRRAYTIDLRVETIVKDNEELLD
jgi:hypothetical protein